ncbi:gasdermin-E-like [Archocentrus centrarchus]|uniref:gasdermin-E-like n=1 Tax=Archocentrus centrarchus TaxID=63155 RepID=UPI0011EA028B|nr:gasdermin-E-like [Archocentrus centrarchus]
MFSKATANLVHEIDPDGLLIHVSRVNDSHKLVPMALVIKRKRWFWQRPKYQPTDFTLSDLLLGNKELTPGVSESEFLTYKGTYGSTFDSELGPEAGSASVKLEGRGTTKLQSCFGKLKKEEVDVKKLLLDSSNRSVDMQHVLVQQLEKRAEVVALVKERIFTTSPCSITQTKVEECTFQGVLGLVGMLGSSVKVCVKDSNSIEVDSDVAMEIPSGTVIAYSILELEIKKDGQYHLCLKPGTIGGFESDSISMSLHSEDSFSAVDGKCNKQQDPQKVPLIALHNETQEKDLSPLAELPQSTRWPLFKKLQETLKDRPALSYLQLVLEDLCRNGKHNGTTKEEQASAESHTESTLNAAHLLVSALEELPDETLELLSKSCPDFLQAFNTLVCRFKKSSCNALSIQSLPALLQDNQAFQLAEQLLCSAGVKLRRDADQLWIESRDNVGVLPVVLFLSVHGLHLLCNALQ